MRVMSYWRRRDKGSERRAISVHLETVIHKTIYAVYTDPNKEQTTVGKVG